jgi:hypothetical protein
MITNNQKFIEKYVVNKDIFHDTGILTKCFVLFHSVDLPEFPHHLE